MAKKNKRKLSMTLTDLGSILAELQRIKIDLIKSAKDPERVRSLAHRIEDLL